MSKDKNLEKIKNGEGIKDANTTKINTDATCNEQRGDNYYIRLDLFGYQEKENK